jgi:hypothetical protein
MPQRGAPRKRVVSAQAVRSGSAVVICARARYLFMPIAHVRNWAISLTRHTVTV